MKVSGRSVGRFLKTPGPEIEAVLIYGPDNGLVSERAATLTAALGIDPDDPFAQSELSGADITSDPARLRDDCAALSLGGGRRLVLVKAATDALTPAVEALLADPPGAALLLLQGGDLPARSRLRKLFEQSERAAAVPCYQDDAQSLPAVIRQSLDQAGFDIAPDALDHLVAHLGADRQMTRRELEKLVLYVGEAAGDSDKEGARRRIGWAEVSACLADGSLQTLDELTLAVGDGDLEAVDRGLRRLSAEGVNAVSLLRALMRHFHRLLTAAEALAKGGTAERAVEGLRPPVFWKHKGRITAQLRCWPASQLLRAEQELLEAEILCKSSGLPASIVAERAALTLARRAAAAQRRRA
ncbi:MAG: DNA polymerase III subunit delta [Kiloniellales bacterium]|nr:DNA polymerase III subunit delta [Kiloniellales bacterium]